MSMAIITAQLISKNFKDKKNFCKLVLVLSLSFCSLFSSNHPIILTFFSLSLSYNSCELRRAVEKINYVACEKVKFNAQCSITIVLQTKSIEL